MNHCGRPECKCYRKCCDKCAKMVMQFNRPLKRGDGSPVIYCTDKNCPCHTEKPVQEIRFKLTAEPIGNMRLNGVDYSPVNATSDDWSKEFDKAKLDWTYDEDNGSERGYDTVVEWAEIKSFFASQIEAAERRGEKAAGARHDIDCFDYEKGQREARAAILSSVEKLRKDVRPEITEWLEGNKDWNIGWNAALAAIIKQDI